MNGIVNLFQIFFPFSDTLHPLAAIVLGEAGGVSRLNKFRIVFVLLIAPCLGVDLFEFPCPNLGVDFEVSVDLLVEGAESGGIKDGTELPIGEEEGGKEEEGRAVSTWG